MSDEAFRRDPGHHDVFISYAQPDKHIADAVCAKLESRNIRCWIAPRDISPGKNFPEAIIEGIEGGKVVVLIFSSHANTSPHVTRELTNAVNKGRIIVPFRVEDVTPSKSMEYLISVPHWLDAVAPPIENHIELLVGTVECLLDPDQKPGDCLPVVSDPESPGDAGSPAPGYPCPAAQLPAPGPGAATEPGPGHKREGAVHAMTVPRFSKKILVIAGITLAAVIILFAGMHSGTFNSWIEPVTSNIGLTPTAPTDYRSSDTVVNTVVLTTEPTETLAKDTELFVDASKDDSNAMVTIQFNGGPGMGLVKDNQVILTRSDGTVAESKLNFNQRLSEISLQGTRGTDRVQVIITLYSGSTKTILDRLLPYRAYH
jgi:TIR domain